MGLLLIFDILYVPLTLITGLTSLSDDLGIPFDVMRCSVGYFSRHPNHTLSSLASTLPYAGDSACFTARPQRNPDSALFNVLSMLTKRVSINLV